ncbi:Protein of unknown function [Pyronema omphalodes CBS 100304]|uniref:Uncharacterized protein n=1 Tax=Pyronema omphalodes (strain CBS 100304) TaxID=1076935 RepID=U4LVF6_PYROM|nr:Protein of unknown function [Pyronema omphalodes CBS 100304]
MLGIIPVVVYGQTLAFRFSFGRTGRPNQIHLALSTWYLVLGSEHWQATTQEKDSKLDQETPFTKGYDSSWRNGNVTVNIVM